ncbi:MAG: prolipoprotein diacylglyceryl transferase [Chlamydiia bacterium]|nr:prolipoprotein diacylglyceryl transferase [Chlamydiia bacterium]
MENWFFWDPDPISFVVPGINRPIAWYGVFFALGFFVGFYLLRHLCTRYFGATTDWTPEEIKKKSHLFSERLTLYMVIATVVGARLGHILFYENLGEYLRHPIEIIKTWEGGLASHGGAIGILIAIVLFARRSRKDFPFISSIRVIDLLVVPALLVGTFIRLGNFVNQEVLGTVTHLPWGVIFGHPIDGSIPEPRHPAQLYEALFYFSSFLVFCRFFPRLLYPRGRLAGWFFITTFGFRMVIEFIKEEQSTFFHSFLTMGQVLSIPFILLGVALLIKKPLLKEQEEGADQRASSRLH